LKSCFFNRLRFAAVCDSPTLLVSLERYCCFRLFPRALSLLVELPLRPRCATLLLRLRRLRRFGSASDPSESDDPEEDDEDEDEEEEEDEEDEEEVEEPDEDDGLSRLLESLSLLSELNELPLEEDEEGDDEELPLSWLLLESLSSPLRPRVFRL